MFNLRRLLAVLILVAVLALGGALWRHLQQQSPRQLLEALPKQVDLALDQLHYTQNEDGQRSWTLDADNAEYSRDSGQAMLDAVRLTMYDAGQFDEVKLTADKGALEQERQQVEVWGNVSVRTEKGQQLYTERLRYDGQQRQIVTAAAVRVVSPRMELKGTGMQIDLDSGHLLLKNDVWMLLLPEERKPRGDE